MSAKITISAGDKTVRISNVQEVAYGDDGPEPGKGLAAVHNVAPEGRHTLVTVPGWSYKIEELAEEPSTVDAEPAPE